MPPPSERPPTHVGLPGTWTFLSNHAHVLVCLAADNHARLRDVASAVGITERGVSKIVAELESAGIIEREREGRRNRYRINRCSALRHPLETGCTVGQLLTALAPDVSSLP